MNILICEILFFVSNSFISRKCIRVHYKWMCEWVSDCVCLECWEWMGKYQNIRENQINVQPGLNIYILVSSAHEVHFFFYFCQNHSTNFSMQCVCVWNSVYVIQTHEMIPGSISRKTVWAHRYYLQHTDSTQHTHTHTHHVCTYDKNIFFFLCI